VKEAGFTVSLSNETHLTKEMAEQLYGEHREKEYFEELTNMMTRSATYLPSFIAACLTVLAQVTDSFFQNAYSQEI
jgi:nucleoside diphosphate kinase